MIIPRWQAVLLLLIIMGGVFIADMMSSAPLDPYQAPPFFALGSGEAPAGAHCSAVLSIDM